LKEKKQREIYICKVVIFNFVIVGLNSILFRIKFDCISSIISLYVCGI